jgi:beta-galactosidase
MNGEALYVTGDLNSTTTLEIIGAPSYITDWYFNGQKIDYTAGTAPLLSGSVTYSSPAIDLPDLETLNWASINSLPELLPSYDDFLWTAADLTYTNNTNRPNLGTPTSLYAADYGYNTGALIYRGRFTATGSENNLNVELAGGEGFSASIWLNSSFIGSYAGNAADQSTTISYSIPTLTAGTSYVLNVLIDQTGFEESQTQGADFMKEPRGILSYDINGHAQTDVSWKLTGNLHGEAYEDRTRGPLNEGGLFAERQGYHLPNPPSGEWTSSSPLTGTSGPGVAFYS